MAFLRKERKENYTCISNDVFRSDLSLKARGMLCTMLSLPDDWEFSENGLQSILKDGQTSVRSAIKELESAGFLSRTRERDENGRMGKCVWIVCDYPRFENPNLVNPNLVNEPQLSTKESSTNRPTTKESKNTPIAPQDGIQESVDEVTAHLNEVTGKRFNPRKDSTRKPIAARLREGYSVRDCIAVIDCKVAQWSKDPRMRPYLRPETLFRESKFEAYLNESPVVDMSDCPF
jgi:uncharacterized phage protein (TIGR02220 family)